VLIGPALSSVEERLIRPIGWRLLEKTYDRWREPLNVFARTACVGNQVLSRSFRLSHLKLRHAQKCHLDFLNLLNQGFRPTTRKAQEFASLNPDSARWFAQLCQDNILETFLSSDLSFFDSFCELTDLKVEIDSGVHTYGHRSDFFQTKKIKFNEINLEETWSAFSILVKKKQELNPKHPIIYLHYSSRNDPRRKYRDRADKLLELARSMENCFSIFRVLKLDEEQYIYAENDNLPYHYGNKTIDLLTNHLSRILSDYGIRIDRYTIRN
jgi:hypothetical protein